MLVIMPTIGWAWPALAPLAGAVAGALGYKVFSEPKGIVRGGISNRLDQMRREQVAMDSILTEVVAEELDAEERLLFERDDLILVFRKDGRGKFFVEVLGPREQSALNLKLRAEEFATELVRKFAYHRIQEQLARIGASVVEERVDEQGRIELRARRWQ